MEQKECKSSRKINTVAALKIDNFKLSVNSLDKSKLSICFEHKTLFALTNKFIIDLDLIQMNRICAALKDPKINKTTTTVRTTGSAFCKYVDILNDKRTLTRTVFNRPSDVSVTVDVITTANRNLIIVDTANSSNSITHAVVLDDLDSELFVGYLEALTEAIHRLNTKTE